MYMYICIYIYISDYVSTYMSMYVYSERDRRVKVCSRAHKPELAGCEHVFVPQAPVDPKP